METIKLEVSRKIYDNLVWLLRQFRPEDLKITEERKKDQKFLQDKKYLDEQLALIDSGKAKFYSLEEFNEIMQERIKSYESKNSR